MQSIPIPLSTIQIQIIIWDQEIHLSLNIPVSTHRMINLDQILIQDKSMKIQTFKVHKTLRKQEGPSKILDTNSTSLIREENLNLIILILIR